jgi:iron complex outermembrane recepter protein
MKAICILAFTFFSIASFAQTDTSTTVLEAVMVRAFEQGRRQRDVPAAVSVLDSLQLQRFSPASIAQAVNTTAGVRMEERSPGSYRFNIRGSSLRSPFGVRNVKVYYNDLPITDPGGQTYINALGFYNYRSLEIIKGPGSSLYGAGTGGVMAIESMGARESPSIEAGFTYGSFANRTIYVSASLGTKAWKNQFIVQQQKADGYRTHSALERTVATWDSRYQTTNGSLLKTTVLLSDLYYQTPGALTLSEYTANRKAARPSAGGFPSAVAAWASFHQKTFLAGASYNHRFSEALTGNVVAYGTSNRFENPAIRNYGINEEPHGGARASLRYRQVRSTHRFQIIAGGEWQEGRSTVGVYGNRAGTRDSVQTLDRIRTAQSLAFIQADYERRGWMLTVGTSINNLRIRYTRLQPQLLSEQKRNFRSELAPRASLSKRLRNFTFYTSASKGFSPPTTAELFPSGSAVNLGLASEGGWNYELGARGDVGAFQFDVNAFSFSLDNLIVQRRDAGGGDFYTNAGNTSQRGIETSLNYKPLQPSTAYRESRIWLSHTWHRFRYRDFKQLTTDYSGKSLPGVSPHILAGGIDVVNTKGFFGNLNYLYQSAVPLNDANSAFAEDYHLVNAKLGVAKNLSPRWGITLSVGAENLLDAEYSLGNDINAFGGRYYNAAPGRSFYVSLVVQVRTAGVISK